MPAIYSLPQTTLFSSPRNGRLHVVRIRGAGVGNSKPSAEGTFDIERLLRGRCPQHPTRRPFAPTAEQLEGQRKAAAAIEALVGKIPPGLKDQIGFRWNAEDCKGGDLEKLLESTVLIDAQYLLSLCEAGGVLPRCQDIPAAAKISRANIWRLRHAWEGYFSLPVLLWTYCCASSRARAREPQTPRSPRALSLCPISLCPTPLRPAAWCPSVG